MLEQELIYKLCTFLLFLKTCCLVFFFQRLWINKTCIWRSLFLQMHILKKALHPHLHRAVTIAYYVYIPVCALAFFEFTTEKWKTNMLTVTCTMEKIVGMRFYTYTCSKTSCMYLAPYIDIL